MIIIFKCFPTKDNVNLSNLFVAHEFTVDDIIILERNYVTHLKMIEASYFYNIDKS